MMERLPLLSAKMTTQRLPTHVVARPRLLSTFASEDWRVATIVAGAGAGKSVLAAQLLASSVKCRGAVFHADDGDDRPERFWTYVVAALQRSEPGAFDGSESLLKGRTGRAELFVSQLLHDAEHLDRQMVLVVEDLHTIRDASILSALGEIVDYLPKQLRLVLTSRRDLDLPVARWRARSWLVEVRQDDLAFDHDETAQLVTALGMDGLAYEEIESLRTQTEGRWREIYAETKKPDLASFRAADPAFVDAETANLGAALRRVFRRLADDGRALAVGHSPTNEAAAFALSGEMVRPLGKGDGVLVVEEAGGRYRVEELV